MAIAIEPVSSPALPAIAAAPSTEAVHGRGPLAAGEARVRVELVDGVSAVTRLASAAPLRLLAPRARGPAAWLVSAAYGGGLVAGDAAAIALDVGEEAIALLGTQAETRVYRSSGPVSSQRLDVHVAQGGAVAVLPEPVSPFAGARYVQTQRFHLATGASALVLDAVVAGRTARGERWAFDRYEARNEVVLAGRLVLSDALRLVAGEGPAVGDRLRDVALLATVIAIGPRFSAAARALHGAVSAAPADGAAEVLAAASPLEDGVLVRLAARSVEAGLAAIRLHLAFAAEHLGDDPFCRRP